MNQDEIKEKLASLEQTLTAFRVEMATKIATLEAKSGTWGALAAIAVLVLALLLKKVIGL